MYKYKDPGKLAKFLALEKGRFIAHKFPDSLIISADTFVTIDDKKIGKPKTTKEAKEIIKKMSNHHVKVHSGLATIKTDKLGKITLEKTGHVVTKVSFIKISDKDINHIIKSDEVLAKSGAFSIEGEGGKFVDTIEGDYHNVIGLPLFQLKKMLNIFQ
jgi:septum formation protein